MASSSDDNTFNLMTCVLCQHDSDLRFLACLHSCCSDCVAQCRHGTILCPECNIETGQFTNKNFIQPIIKAMLEMSTEKFCAMCEIYNRRTISTHICPECDGDQFCGDCVQVHQSLRGSRHHKPIPFEEVDDGLLMDLFKKSQLVCPVHAGTGGALPLTHFCETCNKKICQVCIVDSHPQGKHKIVKLEHNVQREKQHYTHKFQPLKDECKRIMSNIEETLAFVEGRRLKKQERIAEIGNRVGEAKEKVCHLFDMIAATQIRKFEVHEEKFDRQVQESSPEINKMKTLIHNMLALNEEFEKFIGFGDTKGSERFMFRQMENITVEGKKNKHILSQIQSNREMNLGEPTVELDKNLALNLIGDLKHDEAGATENSPFELTITSVVDARIEGKGFNLAIVSEFKSDVIDGIRAIDFIDEDRIVIGGRVDDPEKRALEIYSLKGIRESSLPHSEPYVNQLRVSNNVIVLACRSERCVKKMDMWGTIVSEIKNPAKASVHGVEIINDRLYFTSFDPGMVYSCDLYSFSDIKTWSQRSVNLSKTSTLCVTKAGELAVFDDRFTRIVLLDQKGRLKFQYPPHPKEESGWVNDICCDDKNRLLVTSQKQNTVIVLSPSCELLCELFTPKQFGIAHPVTSRLSPSGRYLAIGYNKNRIIILERVD